jgi:hypothetical protein
MLVLTPAVVNDVFRAFPQSPPENAEKTNSVRAVILESEALYS